MFGYENINTSSQQLDENTDDGSSTVDPEPMNFKTDISEKTFQVNSEMSDNKTAGFF